MQKRIHDQPHNYRPVSTIYRNAPVIQYKRKTFMQRHGNKAYWAVMASLATVALTFTILTYSK